jgi:hypothetical protein
MWTMDNLNRYPEEFDPQWRSGVGRVMGALVTGAKAVMQRIGETNDQMSTRYVEMQGPDSGPAEEWSSAGRAWQDLHDQRLLTQPAELTYEDIRDQLAAHRPVDHPFGVE